MEKNEISCNYGQMLNSLKYYSFRQRKNEMTKIHHSLNKIQVLTHSYFRENCSFPSIAGFLPLKFISAILLAAGLIDIAEQTASFANGDVFYGSS
jgi:hypothetical protein